MLHRGGAPCRWAISSAPAHARRTKRSPRVLGEAQETSRAGCSVKTGANIDAERGVLSALLQRADPLPALQQLIAKDFFHHLYRRFYAYLKEAIEKGQPLVLTMIADEMKLDPAETAELAALLDPMLVVRNLGELAGYVRIVKRDARLRELR